MVSRAVETRRKRMVERYALMAEREVRRRMGAVAVSCRGRQLE